MFSITPITSRSTFSAIAAARCATRCAAGCGVVTTITSARGRNCEIESEHVAGAGRHVDDEVVGVAPVDVGEELLERLVQHRPAPDDRLVFAREEPHRDEPHAVRLGRDDHVVDQARAGARCRASAASRNPTRRRRRPRPACPRCASAIERFVVTDDLPTPPLPDAIARTRVRVSVNGLARGSRRPGLRPDASSTWSGFGVTPFRIVGRPPAARRRPCRGGRRRPGRRRAPRRAASTHPAAQLGAGVVAREREREADRDPPPLRVHVASTIPRSVDRRGAARALPPRPGPPGPSASTAAIRELLAGWQRVGGFPLSEIGRIPLVADESVPMPPPAAERRRVQLRGHRGHQRLRRPDPARDLPLRPRRGRRRHRGRGRRALRRCTRTSPATTSRSSPAAATSSSRSRARPTTAAPAPRVARRSATSPDRSTPRSRSPSSTTTCSAGCSPARSTRSGPSRPRRSPTRSASSTGVQLAARMDPTEGHRSVQAALGAVADALTAHGFAAHTEARDGSLAIVSECCPFGETAQRYPHVVCALDRGMIRGMLSGSLRRDVAPVRDEPPRRRRPLRRTRLTCPAPISTTRRRHRCAPRRSTRCCRSSASTHADPGPSARRGTRRRGSRSKRRASRSRRCSARDRARSCSPRAAPRR